VAAMDGPCGVQEAASVLRTVEEILFDPSAAEAAPQFKGFLEDNKHLFTDLLRHKVGHSRVVYAG
jgi:hypothetical protein